MMTSVIKPRKICPIIYIDMDSGFIKKTLFDDEIAFFRCLSLTYSIELIFTDKSGSFSYKYYMYMIRWAEDRMLFCPNIYKSTFHWKWDKSYYVLCQNHRIIGKIEGHLISLGSKKFPNWKTIRDYITQNKSSVFIICDKKSMPTNLIKEFAYHRNRQKFINYWSKKITIGHFFDNRNFRSSLIRLSKDSDE